MRDRLLQRQALGIGQRFLSRRIEATGIFAPRSKRESEELGRQFIVLFVGGVGMFGDRVFAHGLREISFVPARGGGKLPLRAPDQDLDAHARQRVGKRRAFGGADRRGNQAHRKSPSLLAVPIPCCGPGQNALTRR